MEAIVCRKRPAGDPKQRVIPLCKHKHDRELSDREQAGPVSQIAGNLQRVCWIPGRQISTVRTRSKININIPKVPFKKIIAGEQEHDVHDQVYDQE
jgi:hypothetical protein